MPDPLKVVSSMATRALLDDLVRAYAAASSQPVDLESVGGVDAAKRVRAGERFDVVVLAGEVIARLEAEGRIVAGSRVDVARSAVAAAVPAGTPRPDIGSEAAVRRAVLDARAIGYSTGPSGDHLAGLLQRWGIADALRDRLVQALETQLDREVANSTGRVREAIAPYTRYIRAEGGRLRDQREALSEVRERAGRLRAEVGAIGDQVR
jgi:ABC-type molybdate transport system substrate-binding protein